MPNVMVKCDFCSSCFDEMSEAVEHEKSCLFNPAANKCGTCQYWASVLSQRGNKCGLVGKDQDDYIAVIAQGAECGDWSVLPKLSDQLYKNMDGAVLDLLKNAFENDRDLSAMDAEELADDILDYADDSYDRDVLVDVIQRLLSDGRISSKYVPLGCVK